MNQYGTGPAAEAMQAEDRAHDAVPTIRHLLATDQRIDPSTLAFLLQALTTLDRRRR